MQDNINWSYISGFFDADGSITCSKTNKGANRTLVISFHNNEIFILESIRDFIFKDLGVKGFICTKVKNKENHNTAYDLKYSYRSAVEVSKWLTILHPKKRHRIEVYNRIQQCTKRNGKYTEEECIYRLKLIEEFFKIN